VLAGRTNKFMVPVLGVDETVEALAAGRAQVSQLGADSSAVGALPVGDGAQLDEPDAHLSGPVETAETVNGGGEVVDAEIVEAATTPDSVDHVDVAARVRDAFAVAKRTGTYQAVVEELQARKIPLQPARMTDAQAAVVVELASRTAEGEEAS